MFEICQAAIIWKKEEHSGNPTILSKESTSASGSKTPQKVTLLAPRASTLLQVISALNTKLWLKFVQWSNSDRIPTPTLIAGCTQEVATKMVTQSTTKTLILAHLIHSKTFSLKLEWTTEIGTISKSFLKRKNYSSRWLNKRKKLTVLTPKSLKKHPLKRKSDWRKKKSKKKQQRAKSDTDPKVTTCSMNSSCSSQLSLSLVRLSWLAYWFGK